MGNGALGIGNTVPAFFCFLSSFFSSSFPPWGGPGGVRPSRLRGSFKKSNNVLWCEVRTLHLLTNDY